MDIKMLVLPHHVIWMLLCLLDCVSSTSWEKLLALDLHNRYQTLGTLGRPVKDSYQKLVVKCALHLVQILDLDEHNQILTTSMKVELVWVDEFLVWNSSDYGKLPRVRVESSQIWVPDIILSNSVAEEEKIDNALVKIRPDGSVNWMQRNVLKSSCQIDMQNYPFDRQTCHLRLKSASYYKYELALLSIYEEGLNLLTHDNHSVHLLKEYIESSEWTVISQVTNSPYIESIEGDELEITLTLRRKSVFFTWILLLPCLFLTILTLVTFWLPPDRPDKTTLAMSIFASFMVLLLVLVGSIPSTASSVPILGIYYFFNMVITALSILLATIVVNINKSHRSKPKVPPWLRMIAIETLGGMFGVHMTHSKVQEFSKEKKRQVLERRHMMKEALTLQHIGEGITDVPEHLYDTLQKRLQETEEEERRMIELEKARTEDAIGDEMDTFGTNKDGHHVISPVCQNEVAFKGSKVKTPESPIKSPIPKADQVPKVDQVVRVLTKLNETMVETRDAIYTLCSHIQDKDEREEARDEKATEWHQVAVALDRTFFFLYLACLIVLAIVSSAILFPRAL